jgi:uncharacterized protein DUF4383
VASRPGAARIAAIGFGLVTVLGLIDGNDVLGLIPVDTADSVLHLAIATIAVVSGLMSRPTN